MKAWKRPIAILLLAACALPSEEQLAAERFASDNAGLFMVPVEVGNLKIYMTNPHLGYAGPRVGTASHVNLHMDRNNGSPNPRTRYDSLVNYHVSKYTRYDGNPNCVYIWESRSGMEWDFCTNDWGDTARRTIEVTSDFANAVNQHGDGIARAAIYAAIALLILQAVLIPVPNPI